MHRISARLPFSSINGRLSAATCYFPDSDSNSHSNSNAYSYANAYSCIHSNPQPNSDMDTSPNPNAHVTTDCLGNTQRACDSYFG